MNPLPYARELGQTPAIDLIVAQLADMERYMAAEVNKATARRRAAWAETPASARRAHLREWMGCMEAQASHVQWASVWASDEFQIRAITCNTDDGFPARALVAGPIGANGPLILALPPSNITPEDWCGLTGRLPPQQQLARQLMHAGYQVICPNMTPPDALEGSVPDYPSFGARPTARDEVWRLATQLGLTFVGLELQAIRACLSAACGDAATPYTVVGAGDAGRLSLILAAIDERAETVMAQQAFGDRADPGASFAWPELIHGWSLHYGDAELVALIAPRRVVLFEPVRRLADPAFRAELAACVQLGGARPDYWIVEHPAEFVTQVLAALGHTQTIVTTPRQLDDGARNSTSRAQASPVRHAAWRARLDEMLEVAANRREQIDQSDLANRRAEWAALVGEFPAPDAPLEPRGRLAGVELQSERVTTYEVCLPVYLEPAVFVRGLLAIPNDLVVGERRPAIICSHGWEGAAESTHQPGVYNAFARRLAERGYVTWSPQSYFRSEHTIQSLYRMASLIGRTEFGLMARLHARGIDYLSSLAFVDPRRIALYGLSYGGYTALWLNGLEPRLAAVVCSGHFNDWQAKTTGRNETSYLYTENASMYVSGILARFNHGDLAALACPRPFLVEVGDADWVVRQEWVEHEFARARAVYEARGAADRIELWWGRGGHQVFGERSFEFLDQWLK